MKTNEMNAHDEKISYEELLKRLKHTEKMLKESANESERLKSIFLANISHEIRTPMNAILGFSGLLRDKSISDEDRNTFLDGITESTQRLLNIIDNILHTAKIESKELSLKEEVCNVDNLINEIFEAYNSHKGNIGKGHIELRLKKEVNGKPLMLTDISKLKQIISNLIDNALKFTEKGHIVFGYEFSNNKSILFFVKDTGIGIPTDKYNAIFEKFNQVNSIDNQQHSGLGVGLSISNFFVQQMGGSMGVKSIINKGSEFYFELPFISSNVEIEENSATEHLQSSENWLKDVMNNSHFPSEKITPISKSKHYQVSAS